MSPRDTIDHLINDLVRRLAEADAELDDNSEDDKR